MTIRMFAVVAVVCPAASLAQYDPSYEASDILPWEEATSLEAPAEDLPPVGMGPGIFTELTAPGAPVEILAPPPLPAPWIGNGWGAAGTGHAGPADPYDIYSWNCHSATNLCTVSAPPGEVRGALICNAGAVNTPAVHSASWSVFTDAGGTDWSCIYNWGNACCWHGGDTPPSVAAGDGQRCARWACDAQYSAANTTTLPAGQMVEIPGYGACVREVVTAPNDPSVSGDEVATALEDPAAGQTACQACCDRRANMWNGSGYDDPTLRWQFLSNCRTLCDGFFGNGTSLGQQYGAGTCAPSTTLWSFSSRYEQCRGCCLDGAGSAYPMHDVNRCINTCQGL